ncbi:MAG: substrate-binding domain-containing protein [Desulfomonile tiedjei]|uniref:Substrate-binding domain-containing protein n=1 Tax=Desulfomonile tiedjei TaxID=2358 RepID=A0A9D6V6G2_9BACT|nr:substrate-binding domain-containing protein [Desulfomonile tiedjei]
MRKYFTAILGAWLVVSISVLSGTSLAQESTKQRLRLNGAAMASDVVDKWAKQFMEKNPGVEITVIGSSAGKGFQSIIDGTAEIGMMSREIRPDERNKSAEKGLKLVEKPIGRSAVAVITHERNPVNELTLEQLRRLFSGEYDNWKLVGGPDEPVRCLTRRIPESGGAVFFWNTVLHGEPFGKSTVMTETWEAILTACKRAQDLPIGIVPASRNMSGVKLLGMKKDDSSASVVPKAENVENGTYPITLTFSFAWDDRSTSPSITKFVDFCQAQGKH